MFLPLYPFHVHYHSIFVNQFFRKIEPRTHLLHLHTPLVMCPKTKLPVLVTVHNSMRADVSSLRLNSSVSILAKLQGPMSYHIEQGLFSRADQITTVALSVAQELEEYGINPLQVAVLGNGVDIRLFSPNGNRTNSRRPYFLTVGRLGPRKGLDDLINCARLVCEQFQDHLFYIAGSGPFESKLRSLIRRYSLGRQVKLLGHTSDRRQLADLYRGAAAFVHPAHYEGLPTVLLEAMACGCPIVATSVSGTLDVIDDGVNGLLVPPKNPSSLAEAITYLTKQPDLARRLGNAAYQTVKERYSWEIVGRNYLSQYQELLAGRPA
jgi:glycosyltransferase involved in cell wall biosynthesis